MSWHHLLFHLAAASDIQPCSPGWLLPDLLHLPAMKGDALGEISAFSRHSLSLGCPLAQRHSQGLCCLNLLLTRSRGYPAHTSAVLPTLSHLVWGTLGHPQGLLSRSRALQWHPLPVAMPRIEWEHWGRGGTASPHSPAPLADKPQNFAPRGKG